MANSSPYHTPSKGRLSLLSSDIEEDLGLIDFEDPNFVYFLDNDTITNTDQQQCDYDQTIKWLESVFKSKNGDDPFFDLLNGYHTPETANEFNRFNHYLTKSVTRTATITKRKVEPVITNQPPDTRFGTITKRTIVHPEPLSSPINRTYEIVRERDSRSDVSNSNNNQTYEILYEGDSRSDSSSSNNTPVLPNKNGASVINTNTITKYRRPGHVDSGRTTGGLGGLRQEESSSSSFSDCSVSNIDQVTTVTSNDFDESSEGITNNKDLQKKQLNRTFDKYNNTEECNNSGESTTTSNSNTNSSSRNYPTISRNTTKTLLRREASHGTIQYSSGNTTNQTGKLPKASYLNSACSNDNLLLKESNSNSNCSVRSSNLSITSNISGRSEPNIAHSLMVLSQKKFSQSRLLNNNNTGIQQQQQQHGSIGGQSRIARPSSQNAPMRKTSNRPSKLPSSSAFSSTNSLQSNMRTSSQTGLEMSEDNEILRESSSIKLLSAVSRNSTFRVHRPTAMVNVATLFAEHQHHQPVAGAVNGVSVKYNSDDNLLHCSQEEIDRFRAKVLNSSSGNLRALQTYSNNNNHHQQQHNAHHQSQSHAQFASNHNSSNNTRSDSPSSNSSSCSSSNSSVSRMRIFNGGVANSVSNRQHHNNNNHHNGNNNNNNNNNQNGHVYSLESNDSSELSLRTLNNNNFAFLNNNNFGTVTVNTGFGHKGSSTATATATTTNVKVNSRIPAFVSATTTNRSGIPISGIALKHTNLANSEQQQQHHQTLPRRSQLGGNKNLHLDRDNNSWQNDCF